MDTNATSSQVQCDEFQYRKGDRSKALHNDRKEYSLHLNVPESVLKMLLDVLEHEGWDVDLDDAELINGWYEDVYIFKQVAVGIDQ